MKEKPLISPIKISNRKKTIFYIGFFVYLIIGFIITVHISDNWDKQLTEKYPLLKKESEVNGIVTDILHQKSVFITLNNGAHIEVRYLTNDQYKSYDFCNFIQFNDSLSKKTYSDTLYVFREGQKYFFVANLPYYPGWEDVK